MKDVVWNPKAKEFVRSLPVDVRREFGVLILLLQKGINIGSPASKPVKLIHANAFELRVKDGFGQYRVIYVLALKGKILIPHAFIKKTQKIPPKEVNTAKLRLKELLDEIE